MTGSSKPYLLDTNIVIYLINRHPPEVLAAIEAVGLENCYISAITQMELMIGAASRSERHRQGTKLFIEQLNVVPFGAMEAEVAAQVAHAAGERGRAWRQKRLPDIQIAATALANGMQLVSNNPSDFTWYQPLADQVENWVK